LDSSEFHILYEDKVCSITHITEKITPILDQCGIGKGILFDKFSSDNTGIYLVGIGILPDKQ